MKTFKGNNFALVAVLGTAVLGLSACSGIESEAKYPTGSERDGLSGNEIYEEKEGILGGGKIFGRKKNTEGGENGIGVNSFLWRATLDTVSFMPLASADPFGGVILTDWYTEAATPNERVKINAFILGRELKANALRVRTFRQQIVDGVWRDVPVSEGTDRKLEDAILTRARELRISHLADER